MVSSTVGEFTSGLILSQRFLEGHDYVDIGRSLSEALKDEDLTSRYLPLKAWDTLKSILNYGTKDGILAINNIAILFEPTLRINPSTFLKEAMTGRQLILKLEHPVAGNYRYYPFPEASEYYLDLAGINTTTC